jgi:hypothetical protein
MPGQSLTVASTLMCPHGGTALIVTTNSRASAGALLATASDSVTIAGCPFTLPGPAPSPCVTVQWVVPEMRVKIGGAPGLDTSSVGLCLSAAGAPQGPVIVQATQPRMSGQ